MKASLNYMLPGATMTLADGLEEYRASFEGLVSEDGLAPESRTLFHCHDLCHVVFGCDTSLEHEGMVDTWTLFGSDVGFGQYMRYLSVPEAQQIFRQVGYLHALRRSVTATPMLFRVFRNARAMRKRWPFLGGDAYLDRRLDDLREEFGIRLV